MDKLGEGPWDSFLFTSDIFYRLEKVARIGLHSNIWVRGGGFNLFPLLLCAALICVQRSEFQPSLGPDQEKVYCSDKKAQHVPKLS